MLSDRSGPLHPTVLNTKIHGSLPVTGVDAQTVGNVRQPVVRVIYGRVFVIAGEDRVRVSLLTEGLCKMGDSGGVGYLELCVPLYSVSAVYSGCREGML